MPSHDAIGYNINWTIHKFSEEHTAELTERLGHEPELSHFLENGYEPFESTTVDGNLLTTAGVTRLASLATGSGQALTNTSARLGVGNGTGTAAVGDTDLSAAAGSTNRWFKVMDASYPTTSAGAITLQSTFGSADGNFAWNEFGADIGTPTVTSGNTVNATLFNHKTSIAQGTKTSGQSWGLQATITFS